MMLQLAPDIKPYSQSLLDANRLQGGNIHNQTALLQLAEMRRQQEAAALARAEFQQDPSLLLGGGGPQSTLGDPALAMASGGGPMTQQTVMPGMAPQPPQQVPGGIDLSRFAQGPPGGAGPGGQAQSTIESLGGPPQPQPQRLEALMRQNPDAAMQVMQQQLKMQEQQLGMREKVAGAIGRMLQGVNDQASLDQARDDIRQISARTAAQLPPFYSKEALEPFIERALSVKEAQTLKIQDLQAQADAVKAQAAAAVAQREMGNIPNYTGDAQLDALIYTKMKAQPPGSMPSREIVDAAIQQREADKLRVSREQGAAQEAGKPLGETQLLRFNTLTQAEDTVKKLTTEFTPEERKTFVGMGGITMGTQQLQQLYADATGGKADPKFARFAALVALAKAEAFSTAGKALTEPESEVVYGYIPTGKEYSAEEFEQKLTLAQERVPSMLDRELKFATTPRSELPGMRARGELGATPTPRQAPGGPRAQGGGKVLSEADITTTMQKSGKTREEVLAAARAKGYTLR
jgi:hypothetical protein